MMPILETGNKTIQSSTEKACLKKQLGLTFIEIMVVVLILGLMSSVVILSLPKGQVEAREEAFRFAARLKAAREMAVMRGQYIGLEVEDGNYSFLAYENGEWAATALPGDRVGQRALADNVEIRLDTAGYTQAGTAGGDRGFVVDDADLETSDKDKDKEPLIPEARFEPTGDAEPVVVSFIGSEETWQVSLGPGKKISIELTDE